MKRLCLSAGLTATFLLLARPAAAVDGVFDLGYSFGGDELATVYYTNGSSSTTKANQGLDLAVGVAFGDTGAGHLQGRLMAGYVYGGAGASNGGVNWRSPHVDALALYSIADTVRIGVGGTYDIGPEVKSTGDLSGLHIEFDDALGTVVMLEFDTRVLFFDVRYTSIDYDVTAVNGVSTSGASANGDSFGLYIGSRW